RIIAVACLVAGAEVRCDLQAVDVELEFADVAAVLHRGRALRVGPIPGSQQRKRHPVASLRWKLGDLTRVDVAGELGRRRLDEWRLSGYRYGLRELRARHLHIDRGCLSDQDFDTTLRDGRESGQLRRDLVQPDAHGDLIRAAPVADTHQRLSRSFSP